MSEKAEEDELKDNKQIFSCGTVVTQGVEWVVL